MCLALLKTKSLTAAVSGSEKAVGPWYVSKHLSLEDPPATNERCTLRFLINVLDQISVLVGNFVEINKHTGPNKYTGAKLLAQKYNFL